MVAFLPSRDEDGRYHSAAFTTTTATYPESPGLHLVMRISMGIWRHPEGWRKEPGRPLDVSMPALGGGGDNATWRHSAFERDRCAFERGKPAEESTER